VPNNIDIITGPVLVWFKVRYHIINARCKWSEIEQFYAATAIIVISFRVKHLADIVNKLEAHHTGGSHKEVDLKGTCGRVRK
jgi:hypothetical protein